MASFTYSCSDSTSPSKKDLSNVSGSVDICYGPDVKLTCTAAGATSVYLDLGIGVSCTGYSNGKFDFKAWLFLSKNSSWSTVSGSTIYLSAKPELSTSGGNPSVTGLSYSNLTLNDVASTAYKGDYSATSYKTNGVIAQSASFSVSSNTSDFSVAWSLTLGGRYVKTSAIVISTANMQRTLTYNYNGFTSSTPVYSVSRLKGESVTLVDASNAQRSSTTETSTKSIYFNTNSGEGVFNTITKTYSRETTYTPNRWSVGSFNSSYTLNDNVTTTLEYVTYTPSWAYESITIPSNVPTRYGYTFKNWSSSAGGSYSPGASIYLNQNYTLTAQWESNSYVVRYHADGWSNVPRDQTVYFNNSITASSNTLTRNGCNWDGKWKTSDGRVVNKGGAISGADYYDLAVKNNNVLDLYLNSYSLAVNTISLNANGGTLSSSTIIQYNVESNIINIPQPNPPVGDYIFVGWTSNQAICGQSYADVTVISINPANETDWNRDDITLTARYVRLGKFVNIRGSWRPILGTWYKKNGSWICTENAIDPNKGVGKTMIKVNGSWHKEIGS